MLRLQALNKSNYAVTIEKRLNQFGTPMSWTAFEGIPLRRVDQLVNNEARVAAQGEGRGEPPLPKKPALPKDPTIPIPPSGEPAIQAKSLTRGGN